MERRYSLRNLFLILIASLMNFQFHGPECFARKHSKPQTLITTTPTPLPAAPEADTEGFLRYKPAAGALEKETTERMLDQQTPKNYEAGKTRAQQMVSMLQNQELTKALQKVTQQGKQTLDQNPEIKTPLAVIAGAASLWYGRTLKIVRGDDFNLSARMEARARRSEFSMGSPLLSGKLRFDGSDGMDVGVNRHFSPLQTDAAFQYNVRNQVFSTEVRRKLSPNIDLTFGASRIDQNTKIEYRINF